MKEAAINALLLFVTFTASLTAAFAIDRWLYPPEIIEWELEVEPMALPLKGGVAA